MTMPNLNTEQFYYRFQKGDDVYKGVHLKQASRRRGQQGPARFVIHFDSPERPNIRDSFSGDSSEVRERIDSLLGQGMSAHSQGFLYKEGK